MAAADMRLRGAPSLPDANLASSRARRSTAFSGSFTEPVRIPPPQTPMQCSASARTVSRPHRLSPPPSFDPPLRRRPPNGGTHARKRARPLMMHPRRARVEREKTAGNQGDFPRRCSPPTIPHPLPPLPQMSDMHFATVTQKTNTGSSRLLSHHALLAPHSRAPFPVLNPTWARTAMRSACCERRRFKYVIVAPHCLPALCITRCVFL
jgi:hypothetical protein